MPCPFLLAIERVELLCEAGNTLVSSHQATQLMHPFRHLPQTAINLLQKPMGFFSDISATAVSAGRRRHVARFRGGVLCAPNF